MATDQPILVTGCPRSGTTWTGNVIGASREVFQVYEPFNDDVGARLNLPDRFMRLTCENSPPVRRELDDLVSLGRFGSRSALAVRGVAERWRPGPKRYTPARLAARRLLRHRKDFLTPHRVCIKDPIAFFSAEWLAQTYGAQVVVMLRHPCGVISSYLSLDWDSELEAILERPIPEGYPELAEEVARRKAGPQDKLSDLILQWKLFTAATLDLQRRHPDWMFILHDDLCLHPGEYFERIFRALDLRLTPLIADKIRRESSSTAAGAGTGEVQHQHERDSRAVIDAWRKKLPHDAAERILAETADLWEEAQNRLLPG